MTVTDARTSAYVDDDGEHHRFRVHRSTMTSPDVFALEIERIFGRCWLYVGHESEIRERGDYVRRPIANRQVFMVRSKSGQVKVFHNTCPHRGATICRKDSGNAKVFQCFYHAWSFDTEGSLVGVPDREAYGDGLDFSALGLRSVARVESYRGFVFACFDEGVVGLVEYLAGAAEYLDLIVDATGDAEIISGTNAYAIDANWKLLAENSIDGYHAVPTHDTYFKYLTALGTSLAGGVAGTAVALGNGHAVLEYRAPWGRPVAKWEPLFGDDAREEIDRLRADLVERHGEERASRMADTNRNLLIYPNLVVNDIMAITVRTFMPTSADRMEVTAWELAPRDELPELRQRRLDSFLTFLGPGGFATPDDIEALESCQQGFRSGGVEWNDISRGMARDVPQTNDEEQMRAFWRQWNADVTGGHPMTAVVTVTRAEVEDFLYREAELLDSWNLDGWLALWTEDARYVVPCNDTPDGDPSRDLVLIDDNALRLASRVERLNSRKAHREYPHSTTSHQVSNVRLRAMEGDELPVVAEFTVWRFRGERSTTYVGRYTYRLRIVDGELRIRSKRAVLAMGSLRQVADVAIIL